jgi:hypothetical protein
MLGLALVAAAGLPVVLAPAIAALATAAASAYPPCVAATTPRLVDEADLLAANAARSVIGQVCIVAGPGFGALLLLLGSPGVAFALNAAYVRPLGRRRRLDPGRPDLRARRRALGGAERGRRDGAPAAPQQ